MASYRNTGKDQVKIIFFLLECLIGTNGKTCADIGHKAKLAIPMGVVLSYEAVLMSHCFDLQTDRC